jgi:hypothetical protein
MFLSREFASNKSSECIVEDKGSNLQNLPSRIIFSGNFGSNSFSTFNPIGYPHSFLS